MKIDGKGSLREVRPGVWVGRFNLGADPDKPGKYLYTPARTFHCEYEWEARAALEAYRLELQENGIPDKKKEYLAGYAKSWLESRKGTHGSPRTADREKLDIKHIEELFPKVRLKSLTPTMINNIYAEARESGRFDKEIYQINKRLRQILDAAIEEGYLKKNPARKVTVPKPDPEEKDYLDPERLARFNAMLLELPVTGATIGIQILMRTGLRPAEMFGLSWEDVNFAESKIAINHQFSNDLEMRKPKSKASKSWIAIDSTLWQMLFDWKLQQKEELKAVAAVQSPSGPVASNAFGKRIDPTNFGRYFRNLCADTGFGTFRTVTKTFTRKGKTYYRGKDYQGLSAGMFRDVQATMLVGELGADPKTVQSRLRHSDLHTTLTYYTQRISNNDYIAASKFESLLANESV